MQVGVVTILPEFVAEFFINLIDDIFNYARQFMLLFLSFTEAGKLFDNVLDEGYSIHKSNASKVNCVVVADESHDLLLSGLIGRLSSVSEVQC